MCRYKITLEPIDWFFFGGEQTFDNGVTQSFIARSNRMPQQTTLLGMVRYQLLKKKLLLPLTHDNKTQADALIGPSSFDIGQCNATFGKIKSLSPVFIQRGRQRLVPVPLNYGYDCAFDNGTRVWMSGHETAGIISVSTKNGCEYDDKEYWKKNNYGLLVDQNGMTMASDELFLSNMQIGITKGADYDDNKKGFCKQETLRFTSTDTKFAFYLELAEDGLIEDDYVFIGAQRSCFKMKVELSDEQPVIPSHGSGTILLLSPTYIDSVETLNTLCRFHWSYGLPFRNLVNAADGKLRSGGIAYRRQGSVCTMLAPGSVLFYHPDKMMDILTLLNKPHLQQIGYNQYHIEQSR